MDKNEINEGRKAFFYVDNYTLKLQMNLKFLFGSAVVLSVGAIAWAAKDPIVMTVNGEDVPRSEFEYLYNKNSQQQIEAQPLEEYIGMFELYKMKVADAKAEGIDTMASFISEMEQYRRDLAEPYLTDTIFVNSLVDEAYQHSLEELDYYHIMFQKGRSLEENQKNLRLADSIRNELLNGADFAELARNFSFDRSAVNNGGNMGFIAAGRLPYSFEHAAYSLQPGQISDIVESSAGYHILKGGERRPARGSVRAAHIMKMARPGSTPEQEAKAKAEIDSLYLIVSANPDIFEQVAMKNSDDPGSARLGGQLGWFAAGQMVPEFSDKAFEIAVGEVSEPVRTTYGWHIIKKLDAKGVPSEEEIKPELIKQFNDPRDERFKLIRKNLDKNLAKKHNGNIEGATLQELQEYVATNGLDSAFYTAFSNSTAPLFFVERKPVTVSTFVKGSLGDIINPDPYVAGLLFEEKFESAYNDALVKAEEEWIYANNADYRHLLNEYRDGSLLYEVSLRKVWDKAANDVPGLENYFEQHRSEYTFKEPRAKGYLVMTKNDSLAADIKNRFAELAPDSAFQVLRKEYRQDAIIDRLLAPQGINKYVDRIMFDGPEPEANSKYPVYFVLEGRVITEPEEMNDVKGAVTADYQQLLEQNWTTELRKKYPVKRYDKELKKISRK